MARKPPVFSEHPLGYVDARSREVADVWVLHYGASGLPLRGRLRIAGTEWVHVQQILLDENLVDLIYDG